MDSPTLTDRELVASLRETAIANRQARKNRRARLHRLATVTVVVGTVLLVLIIAGGLNWLKGGPTR